MDEVIADFTVELVEPGCAPGAGRWGALVSIDRDISPVFPYLNAVLPNAQYDHENEILIWQEREQRYAFRRNEIRVANVTDLAQAEEIVGELVDKVNRVWQDRDDIVPRLATRKLASVLDVFKLLPRTNCGQCGYLTCLAYAAALRQGAAHLGRCLPLSQPEYAENRQGILSLISDD